MEMKISGDKDPVNLWVEQFSELNKSKLDASIILDWYKQSTNRSKNPYIMIGVDEKNKGILQFVNSSLIKSGFGFNDIRKIVDYLKNWYLNEASTEQKANELILIDILIKLHTKFMVTMDQTYDNKGSLLLVLKSFLGGFFNNFDEETLDKLRFADYFLYGLNSDEMYQYKKVMSLNKLYKNPEKRDLMFNVPYTDAVNTIKLDTEYDNIIDLENNYIGVILAKAIASKEKPPAEKAASKAEISALFAEAVKKYKLLMDLSGVTFKPKAADLKLYGVGPDDELEPVYQSFLIQETKLAERKRYILSKRLLIKPSKGALDSPLIFLNSFQRLMDKRRIEKLDSLREISEENPSLIDKRVEFSNFMEIYMCDLVLAMLQTLRNYGPINVEEIDQKVDAILDWLNDYSYLYLNSKGDKMDANFYKSFVSYFRSTIQKRLSDEFKPVDPTARSGKKNITIYGTTETSADIGKGTDNDWAVRKRKQELADKHTLQNNLGLVKWARDKKSISLRIATLIVFISKIRTAKASGVEFHNHSQFCDYLDQMKTSDVGVGEQIDYFSLDPSIFVPVATFYYRSDFDFLVGFNVEGFNLDYNFWKTINEMCLDPSLKLPPFGFYLGLVSAGCVDPPLRLESFYNSLKDSLGPLGFSRLCSENDRLMRDMTVQINKVKGTCPDIIEKINSKYLIKSLCSEDSIFKEINDKLKSINYFQGFLDRGIIDAKIKMIGGLFDRVDKDSKELIDDFNSFTAALGIKTSYTDDDTFYEILHNSLMEIYRNATPLFIALDYDETSVQDTAAELAYILYSLIEIIKKEGIQKSATKLDPALKAGFSFVDPASKSDRHSLIYQTVKAFLVTMKTKIPDPIKDDADLCKRLELINYSPIEEYSRIASLIIDIDPKDPVNAKSVETFLGDKERPLKSPDAFFSLDKLHPMYFRGGASDLSSKIAEKKEAVLDIQRELAGLSGDKTRVDALVDLVLAEFDALKIPALKNRGSSDKNEAFAEDQLNKLLKPKIADAMVQILRLKSELKAASPSVPAAAAAATAAGPASTAAVAGPAPKTVDDLITYYQGLLKDKLDEKIIRKPTDPPVLDLTPDSKEYPLYVQLHLILRYIYINCIPLGYKLQAYSNLIKDTTMPLKWYSKTNPSFYSIFKSISYSFTLEKPGENEGKLYALDFERELLLFIQLVALIDNKSCGSVVDTLNVFSKKAHHLLEEHKAIVDGLISDYKSVDSSTVVAGIDELSEVLSGVDDHSAEDDSSDSSWAKKGRYVASIALGVGGAALAGVPLGLFGAAAGVGLAAFGLAKLVGKHSLGPEYGDEPTEGGKRNVRKTIKHKNRKPNRRSTLSR